MRNRELHRRIRIAHRVELLIPVLDAHDDLDRVGLVRRRHLYRLEAPLQRTVLLNRFAVLARRGGADALNLAARKRRLQNVRCIERPFRRSRAHQRVQLVDEHNRVLIFHQLFHDGLQPLFKLPAILGPRHDQRKVERQHALVRQKARYLAVGNALRKTLDNRRLSHARLANQHGVILRAPAQNLNRALQFPFATNQRIKLPIHCSLSKVAAKLRQQTRLPLPLLRRRFLLRHPRQLVANLRQLQPALLKNFRRKALFFA